MNNKPYSTDSNLNLTNVNNKFAVSGDARDFSSVCIFAMRYALGRRTYAPSTVINYILRHIDNIQPLDITVMIRDIEEYGRDYGGKYGDNCDTQDWLHFKNKLQERLDYLENCKRNSNA